MRRRSIYLYGLSFLVFLLVAIIRNTSFNQMHRFTHEVDRTREAINHLERLSNYFKSAQIYSQEYVDPELRQFYLSQAQKVGGELDRLKTLLRDEPFMRTSLDTVEVIIQRNLNLLLQYPISELSHGDHGFRMNDLSRAEMLINQMAEGEQNQLKVHSVVLDSKINTVDLISIILSLIGMAIIVFTFLNNHREYKRRKLAESSLQSVLYTSQAGIITFTAIRNARGSLVNVKADYVNPAIERLTGVAANTLPGKTLKEIDSRLNEQLLPIFKDVMETGEYKEFEQQFGRRWFFVSLSKKDDGVTASFQDITPIRQSQQQLEATIQQLEQSNAELEEYAYVASHDLQEPLRKIQTFANFIWERKQHVFDEKEKQYFQKLILAAHRMSVLVRDLLSLSGLKKKPAFVPTDLNEVLEPVLQDLDLMITQKNAVIHVGSLPTIESVPLQMQQLFYNLIQNALKFASVHRRPEISISARRLSPEEIMELKNLKPGRVYVEVLVADNGIGFSSDQAKNIFGLFKRLHLPDIYPGSGIGLSLCQRITENHHGYIYATGEEDKGARFVVVLPEKQSD